MFESSYFWKDGLKPNSSMGFQFSCCKELNSWTQSSMISKDDDLRMQEDPARYYRYD